jgi:hypothetical protein
MPAIPLNQLVGMDRLSGGKFTEQNVEALRIIGEGVRAGTLEAKIDSAGRHINQSYILLAQQLFIDMGLRSSRPNQSSEKYPEEVNVHKLLEAELKNIRHIEGHGGKGASKIGKNHYHDMPGLYSLCAANDGNLQFANKRLKAYVKEYSYDGIIEFRSDLVRPSATDASNVWDRCDDPKKLSVAEQIQNLYYIESWKYLLKFMQEKDAQLKTDPLMLQHIYPQIANILGWDPRTSSKK